jgi:CBS domain-containing protein
MKESTMHVGEVCHRDAVAIGPFENLTTAAQLMREKRAGFVVVIEPGIDRSIKPVGVLTDRDIVVSVVAREADSRSLRVGDVMTPQPLIAADTDSLAVTLQKMRILGVRRVPVVGADGRLVGVLSLDDVFDALARELQSVPGVVPKEETISYPLSA